MPRPVAVGRWVVGRAPDRSARRGRTRDDGVRCAHDVSLLILMVELLFAALRFEVIMCYLLGQTHTRTNMLWLKFKNMILTFGSTGFEQLFQRLRKLQVFGFLPYLPLEGHQTALAAIHPQ